MGPDSREGTCIFRNIANNMEFGLTAIRASLNSWKKGLLPQKVYKFETASLKPIIFKLDGRIFRIQTL